MRTRSVILIFLLAFGILSANKSAKAQLSAADSIWFTQNFSEPIYAPNVLATDNFFVHKCIASTSDFNNLLDSVFKFSLDDFKEIESMVLQDSIFYDTERNSTFNNYPQAFNQLNPLTYIKFEINGKVGTAYNFFYPRISSSKMSCNRAFVIVPGWGPNTATELVQGNGQYNELCYVLKNLRNGGDVYAVMKPNEDARALYWNNHKVNHSSLVSLLIPENHRYGLNYLIEIIATVKLLKQKYNEVVLLGAAEGGYASTLASMVSHPDASIISGGYSIAFDTSMASFNVLTEKFDSLVSIYNRNVIKNNVLTNDTKYLFAWGDKEPIVLMQAEHDSNYTEKYFNNTSLISYYYNFTGHTFPYCTAIDSFLDRKLSLPQIVFRTLSTSNTDTISAIVQNCNVAKYRFDLFKNNFFYKSYDFFMGDTIIALVDSGLYYLKNIYSSYGKVFYCADTIYFKKAKTIPVNLFVGFEYNNPVTDELIIRTTNSAKPRLYELFDLFGNCKFRIIASDQVLRIAMSHHTQGIYILKATEGNQSEFRKIIKL